MRKIIGHCMFCDELIDTDMEGVEYIKTKRRSTLIFHKKCFDFYNKEVKHERKQKC